MAGTNKIGQPFRYVVPGEEPTYAGSGYYVIQDQVQFADTLAAKGRFRLAQGPVQFYVEGTDGQGAAQAKQGL